MEKKKAMSTYMEVEYKERITSLNEMLNAKTMDIETNFAVAKSSVYMRDSTLTAIIQNKIAKGDVLAAAQFAGIMAAKKSSDIIPMCQNISIQGVDIEYTFDIENSKLQITATVGALSSAAVDMEAMTAATITALTVYDMCRETDSEMIISEIYLYKKTGKPDSFGEKGFIENNYS